MTLYGMAVRGISAVALAALLQGPALAQSTQTFAFPYHNVGRSVGENCWEGLCVTVGIKQVNVPGLRGNSRLCATFHNRSMDNWSGGYRLSNNPANWDRTHASLRVPANSTAERCETLSVTEEYFVVLRRDRGS
ncbi:MAG: hypothetical protein ACXIUO_06660 [Erythrobacter sp.]